MKITISGNGDLELVSSAKRARLAGLRSLSSHKNTYQEDIVYRCVDYALSLALPSMVLPVKIVLMKTLPRRQKPGINLEAIALNLIFI